MPRRVFAVGREIPGNAAEYLTFDCDKSLFDADVIIFTPTFADYHSYETYAGKPLISENDSQALSRHVAHWRGEIKAAVDSGKVVFVALVKPDEVYYYTGGKQFSGTGRSRVTTNLVDAATAYDSIPFRFEGLVPRGGTEISVLSDLGPLALYWNEFGARSMYEVYFNETASMSPLLGTKNREKVVGGLVQSKKGGALVLLPPVKWDETALTYTKGESTFWRKEATVLGQRLVAAFVGASQALLKEGKRTPVPEWATAPAYSLPIEDRARAEVAKVDREIANLAEGRKELERGVEEAAELRALLYEAGKPLEGAVLRALRLMGFAAGPYREGQSEFDAVFTSPEGRFLGEVEGKDSKAVNIDKMSQLERNLQEDFAREGVTDYAKGVLFGNAFRLSPPSERGEAFTQKCVTAAERLGVALVRTADLFGPARYLSDHNDAAYAASCREAIFVTKGTVVQFPMPPNSGGV
jgi:hypothetical protein